MADHPGVAPEKLTEVDPQLRLFFNCGSEQLGSGLLPDGNEGEAAAADSSVAGETQVLKTPSLGEETKDGGEDDGSKRRWKGNGQLCSLSWLDAPRHNGGQDTGLHPCESCLIGASPSHGLPGGAICCGTHWDLSKCPRAWS